MKFRLLSYYYYLRQLLQPSRIYEARDIPIIINNYNRLTTLLALIDALVTRGYTQIFIIDNASTYPPLLEYYNRCPFTVFRLKENLGFKALWLSHLRKRFCSDYYIYTDSDVVPATFCPKDFIDHLFRELKQRRFAYKIGLSLRIDNLPDAYRHKEKVIAWERRFFEKPVGERLFRAPIDTTFALYRPRVGLSRSRFAEVYRTAFPYQAEHLPWYVDSDHLSDEEQYYVSQCRQITAWSALAQEEKAEK